MTTTTASTSTSATQTLLTSLGTGSGIDTDTLVKSLVQAQFAAKTTALTSKAETIGKQISGIATLKSTVTDFSTAVSALIKGGTLQSQPTVSDGSVLSASAISGKTMAGTQSSVTVTRLATAQGAASAAIVDKDGAALTSSTTALSTGTSRFVLTLGTATYAGDGASMTDFAAGASAPLVIDIPAASSSPAGIAAAINARKGGVTASVVTGAGGTPYLSIKGATGTTQAFTLQATTDPDGTMAQFNVTPPVKDADGNVTTPATTNLTGKALNAQLTVDGIAVERSGNTVDDLVAGVKLQLTRTSSTPVTIGATRPTAAITDAVSSIVSYYNEVLGVLKEQTNATDGPLRADPAAKALLKSFQGFALKSLVAGGAAGGATTLSAIGVSTQRDGTLKVSDTTLAAKLASDPDAVEAMFANAADGSTGFAAILKTLSTEVSSTTYGLAASTASYTKAQAQVTTDQATLTTKSDALSTRLTKQYTAMNTAVSAYKATQTYIEQQVALWTKSDS